MKATINSWYGDRFLNDNKCEICGGKSTTIEISTETGYQRNSFNICKGCLLNYVSLIDHAILESKK